MIRIWLNVLEKCFLQSVRLAELVDKSLRSFRLLHDAFTVILTDGATELVVIHGRPVFALAPQFGDPNAVLDLENAPLPVQPADGRAVDGRLREQLFEELPQVNVRPVGRWRCCRLARSRRC